MSLTDNKPLQILQVWKESNEFTSLNCCTGSASQYRMVWYGIPEKKPHKMSTMLISGTRNQTVDAVMHLIRTVPEHFERSASTDHSATARPCI
ncbi:hypothetical protein BaRGS_00014177 [Batillaria attramentaria]|uniref:Uncharacterized protein n=1 Tax=Batillaria attramentaria TaxID=370345 RepID=A0ABD0L545_9CAEN